MTFWLVSFLVYFPYFFPMATRNYKTMHDAVVGQHQQTMSFPKGMNHVSPVPSTIGTAEQAPTDTC